MKALLYDYYPASDYPIELGLKNAPFTDDTNAYWIAEETNLLAQFNYKIKPRLMQGNTDHYSVFAIAPQIPTMLNCRKGNSWYSLQEPR